MKVHSLFHGYNISLQFIGRAMAELRVLRLFGNPLEFLPEILPLHKLRHLSLANIIIEADENLKSVNVQIEVIEDILILVTLTPTPYSFCGFISYYYCHYLVNADRE